MNVPTVCTVRVPHDPLKVACFTSAIQTIAAGARIHHMWAKAGAGFTEYTIQFTIEIGTSRWLEWLGFRSPVARVFEAIATIQAQLPIPTMMLSDPPPASMPIPAVAAAVPSTAGA